MNATIIFHAAAHSVKFSNPVTGMVHDENQNPSGHRLKQDDSLTDSTTSPNLTKIRNRTTNNNFTQGPIFTKVQSVSSY